MMEKDYDRKLVRLDEGLQYVLEKNDSDNNIIQLLLEPQKSIFIDVKALCWSSDSIKMKYNPSFLSDNNDIATLINEGNVLSSAAVGKGYTGKFIALNLSSATVSAPNVTGIYCTKDSFLCSTSSTIIKSTKFPIKSFNMFTSFFNPYLSMHNQVFYIQSDHITISTTLPPTVIPSPINATSSPSSSSSSFDALSTIFLQSGCTIMKKHLNTNESINLSYSCLIAVEDTCQLMETQISSSTSIILMLKVQGPGNVYFGTGGKRAVIQDSESSSGRFGGRRHRGGVGLMWGIGNVGGGNQQRNWEDYLNNPLLVWLHFFSIMSLLLLVVLLNSNYAEEVYNELAQLVFH